MSDTYSPFVKFTYTILDLDGHPQKKSWILNLSYIVSVESGNANDIKINMANDQVVTIELGRDYDASKLLDELLDLSAEGLDYNVYKINSFEKKY
tara:strand:+ start:6396 stop:6680 length:285 start_codon:yes stop_codon:yes gene_type:complete